MRPASEVVDRKEIVRRLAAVAAALDDSAPPLEALAAIAFVVENIVTETVEASDAEVRAAALEEAAVECDERSTLNDSVEARGGMCRDPQTSVVASAPGHRAIEARECAFAIRALATRSTEEPAK